MKRLLPLLLLLSSFAYSQSAIPVSITGTISLPKNTYVSKATIDSLKAELKKLRGLADSLRLAIVDQDPKGIFKRYVPFPAALTPSSPTTLTPSSTQCCGTGVFNYTLVGGVGSGGDVILNGNFTHGFSARQFDGDATHIYRFFNATGTILGGASGTEPGFGVTDHGNYLYLIGKGPTEPMVVKGERGLGGFTATTAGTVVYIENVVGKGNTAAFIQANGNTSAGSYYKTFTIKHARSFLSGQEGLWYLGKTSSGGAVHHRIYASHGAAYSPWRDGWQVEPCDYFSVEHVTVIDAGQRNGVDGSDQKNNFQIEAAHGHVKYGIYDNGVNLFTIFSNGDTIAYNYMSAELPGYIGKSSDLSYYFNSAGLNSHIDGTPIIIENNFIKNKGIFTYAMEIKEEVANVVIRNNNFQGYTTTFLDSRACLPSCSNTITGAMGSNGNVSTTVIEPTYGPNYSDQDNYAQQMLLALTSPYFALHFGNRTP